MAGSREHAAYLAFASLMDGKGQPAIGAVLAQEVDLSGCTAMTASIVFGEGDAFAERLQSGRCRVASHQRLIVFFLKVTRMRKVQGKSAIIGQQQQAAGIDIEAANRIDTQGTQFRRK